MCKIQPQFNVIKQQHHKCADKNHSIQLKVDLHKVDFVIVPKVKAELLCACTVSDCTVCNVGSYIQCHVKMVT